MMDDYTKYQYTDCEGLINHLIEETRQIVIKNSAELRDAEERVFRECAEAVCPMCRAGALALKRFPEDYRHVLIQGDTKMPRWCPASAIHAARERRFGGK